MGVVTARKASTSHFSQAPQVTDLNATGQPNLTKYQEHQSGSKSRSDDDEKAAYKTQSGRNLEQTQTIKTVNMNEINTAEPGNKLVISGLDGCVGVLHCQKGGRAVGGHFDPSDFYNDRPGSFQKTMKPLIDQATEKRIVPNQYTTHLIAPDDEDSINFLDRAETHVQQQLGKHQVLKHRYPYDEKNLGVTHNFVVDPNDNKVRHYQIRTTPEDLKRKKEQINSAMEELFREMGHHL